MIVQIRQSIFETNSSSTHVLSVSKMQLNPDILPKRLEVDQYAKFGWEPEQYNDEESKLSYLYLLAEKEEFDRIITYLKIIGVEVEIYKRPDASEWDYGYVDHSAEAKEFLKKLLDNPDMLYAFIFNSESFIETGNDNCDDSLIDYMDDDGFFEQSKVPGDYVYYKGN